MNERIRELAEQADKLVSEENKYYGLMEYSEKFAELIVRECIEISQVGSITEEKIKQHFGVKE